MEIKGVKNVNGLTKVADWYCEAYPDDEWGNEMLNKGIIFQDVWEALEVGYNIYAVLGAGDSIVRERVFEALAKLMNVDYEVVYQQWLKEKAPCGMTLHEDLTKLHFS